MIAMLQSLARHDWPRYFYQQHCSGDLKVENICLSKYLTSVFTWCEVGVLAYSCEFHAIYVGSIVGPYYPY